MNSLLLFICIFAFISIIIINASVIIALFLIFVYNKWQNMLILKQNLYNLEHFVLELKFEIVTLEGEINNIQTTIDENSLKILQSSNNYNIELANAINECNINSLTDQITDKYFEIIEIKRQILSIKYDIDNWLMQH